jgi:hypothetical protein
MPLPAMPLARNLPPERAGQAKDMDIERRRQLEAIILLSKDMLARAGDGDWALVAEIEGRRRELVVRCFEQPTTEQDAPEVADAIREILRLNQQITELGGQCQDRLGNEINTSKLGRTASAAYLGCAR